MSKIRISVSSARIWSPNIFKTFSKWGREHANLGIFGAFIVETSYCFKTMSIGPISIWDSACWILFWITVFIFRLAIIFFLNFRFVILALSVLFSFLFVLAIIFVTIFRLFILANYFLISEGISCIGAEGISRYFWTVFTPFTFWSRRLHHFWNW